MVKGSIYLTLSPCPAAREPDADLALQVVGADVFARHHRLRGHDVRLAAVSLEQGRDVERLACERGGTPRAVADQWAERWDAALNALGVELDDFVRTTDVRHQRVVKALFLKLFDKDHVRKGTRQGLFCPRCEEFAASDGAGGTCAACGQPLVERTEEAYFLRASRWRRAVLERLESHPELIVPRERAEALLEAAAESGIADLCISRPRHEWSIPVPIDPDHSISVGFDALVSYLTASGYLSEPQVFERYWPPDVQVVTQAGLADHALAWPAMLTALGLPLPERLVVRGRVTLEGVGKAPCDPAALATRFRTEGIRYALLRSAGYTEDARLSVADLVEAANRDLADGLGRLVESTLSAIGERRGGRVPRPGRLGAADEPLVSHAVALFAATTQAIEGFDFRTALDRIWSVVAEAQARAERSREADTPLYVQAEVVRIVAHCLRPFLPGLAGRVLQSLGVDEARRAPADLERWGVAQPQTCIQGEGPVFPPLAVPNGGR